MSAEIVCDFPLSGNWNAPNTPGDKIPSHGTHALGQTYAIDLWRTDINDIKRVYKGNKSTLYTIGLPIEYFLCYNEDVFSPFDGTVVKTYYKCLDPKRINPIWEIIKYIMRSFKAIVSSMIVSDINKINIANYIGNHVIMKIDDNIYCLFAHLSQDSINLKVGDTIKKGSVIGCVGHTGNTTSPHLHFQLMDSQDIFKSKGIPIIFKEYQKMVNNQWIKVENTIPKSNEIIKSNI